MSNIVSAVFDNEQEAQSVIDDLRSSGVAESSISVARHHDGSDTGLERADADAGTGEAAADAGDAGKGALAGLGIGAGVGALFGLAAAFIPGVGPFITAGALASALGPTAGGAVAGAIVGGASGGLAGALSHWGLNEAESHYYAGEVERGATFVGVDLDQAGTDRNTVLDIFRRHNGRWHSGAMEGMGSDTSTYSAGAMGSVGQTGVVPESDIPQSNTGSVMGDRDRGGMYSGDIMGSSRNYTDDELTDLNEDQRRYLRASDEERAGFNYSDQDRQTMRLHEERLQATKRPVQAGEVSLRKEVVTENQTINVPTTREEVVVQRQPVSGADAMDVSGLQPGEEIRVPVMQEQVDVTKTAVPTEEVSIGKRQVTENQQVTDTVSREEARLDRSSDNVNVDVDEDLRDELLANDQDQARRNY